MYLTVTRLQFNVRPTEADWQRVNGESLDRIIVPAHGFHAHYLTMISDTEMLAVSVWDNKADADAAIERVRPINDGIFGSKLAGMTATGGQVGIARATSMEATSPGYLSTMRLQLTRPLTEAEVKRVEEEVIDGVITKTPGFRAYYVVMLSDTEGLNVGLWDSEAAWQAHFPLGTPATEKIIGSLVAAPPQRLNGTVVTCRTKQND